MKRRAFLETTGKGSLFLLGLPALSCASSKSTANIVVETVTSGPKHHFFGYYGMNPWNKSQDLMLSLEATTQERLPEPGEKAVVGLVDLKTGKYEGVAETGTWNLQQGAMLHWNPLKPNEEIYFNDMVDGQMATRKINISSGEESVIPWPVNAMSHNGKYALSLDYGRLGRLRKVVGYSGVEDPNPNDPHPKNDGVFIVDMETGEGKLIISIYEVYEKLKQRGLDLGDEHMWFNHVVFNKSDARILFLARTRMESSSLQTGMFTVNIDGSDLYEAIPYGSSVSHFDWRNDSEIVATFQAPEGGGRKHFLFKDKTQDYKAIGEGNLDFDGHCVFGSDQNWMATDQKIRTETTFIQHLYIYNVETKKFIELAEHNMFEKKRITKDLRCDFHPRWNHTGDKICFDSMDQNDRTRQLHVASFELPT